MDPKAKDSKLFRMKLSKVDVDKADRSSKMSFLYEAGAGQTKALPLAGSKDSESSLDYVKNPGMVIPPIVQIHSPSITGASEMGTALGASNYRYRV